jgi:hypothetical protein
MSSRSTTTGSAAPPGLVDPCQGEEILDEALHAPGLGQDRVGELEPVEARGGVERLLGLAAQHGSATTQPDLR